jgi:hypothetical protein
MGLLRWILEAGIVFMSAVTTQRVKLKIRTLKTTLLVDTQAQMVLDVHVTTIRKHEPQVAPN